MKNDLVVDFEWCYPYNEPHNQATCTNGLINQTLMVQNTVAGQQNAMNDAPKQQHDSHTPKIAFLN